MLRQRPPVESKSNSFKNDVKGFVWIRNENYFSFIDQIHLSTNRLQSEKNFPRALFTATDSTWAPKSPRTLFGLLPQNEHPDRPD